MWIIDKLRKRNRKCTWIECPLEAVEVKAGQKYVLILKDEHADLIIQNHLLSQGRRKVTEALNECYSTIAALEKENEELKEKIQIVIRNIDAGSVHVSWVMSFLSSKRLHPKPVCRCCGGTGKPCNSCGEYHPKISMCPPHEVRMKWAKDICPDCGTKELKEENEAVCMKAFEKWLKKVDTSLFSSEGYEYDVMVAAWRAALEHILSKKVKVKLSPHPDATLFEVVPVKLIEEELGND